MNIQTRKRVRRVYQYKEDSAPPVHSQLFHRVALPRLLLITKALTKLELTRAALLKRLERAHKLWLLTDLFGKEILTAKAVANISFQDTVPFTIFGDLATSNMETAFVTEIKESFASGSICRYLAARCKLAQPW
jgi:hypothetical protein